MEKKQEETISKGIEARKSSPSVGKALQDRRREKKLSIREISAQLRVSERYLQAIESEEVNELPEAVYALGFVRNYANFLGEDADRAIKHFRILLEGQKRSESLTFPVATPENQIPQKPLVLTATALSVVLIATWGYFRFSKSPDTAPVAPIVVTEVKQEPVPEEKVIVVQEKIEQKTLDPKPKDRIQFANFSLGQGQVLKIKSNEKSWVEIRENTGRVLLSRVLNPGEERDIRARPGLVFSTGNAGGVTLSNGTHETHPMGQKGQVIQDIELKFAEADNLQDALR